MSSDCSLKRQFFDSDQAWFSGLFQAGGPLDAGIACVADLLKPALAKKNLQNGFGFDSGGGSGIVSYVAFPPFAELRLARGMA